MGVGSGDAVEFFGLAGGQALVRIEAPDAFKQALAAEDLVDSGDAAVEGVGNIEDSSVGVGEVDVPGEHLRGVGGLDAGEDFDGLLGPDGPLAEEAADDAEGSAFDLERSDEVVDDVVVVAGVEGDLVGAAGGGDAAEDIDGLIAIEGGHFDGDDVFDFGEAPPEGIGQKASADGGLEVEADDGDDLGDGSGVGDQFVDGGIAQGGEAEEDGVVAEGGGEFGFTDGLGSGSAGSGDLEDAARFGGGEFEDRAEEAAIADGELGGVDGDGDASRAGGGVVTGEGALAAFVHFAVRGEG